MSDAGPKDFAADVPPELGGHTLDSALKAMMPGASWGLARKLIASGKVRCNDEVRTTPIWKVRAGDRIALAMAAPHPSNERRLAAEAIAYVDAHVIVVRKPAGVSTVPFDEGERGTLDQLVRAWLGRELRGRGGMSRAELGVVQRLDRDTTGLVVFARTLAAKRELGTQFRAHTVHRRYAAIVHGAIGARTLRSRLVADRGDGLRGSTNNPRLGQEAITHVTPVEALRGATFVACRLETGKTHQIRIHLSEAGHPLVGERVYVRRYGGTLLEAPRVMLHAEELGFVHPQTGAEMRFREALPGDFAAVLKGLGGPA